MMLGGIQPEGLVKNEGLPGYKPSQEGLEARRSFQDDKFGIFIHWGIDEKIIGAVCPSQMLKMSQQMANRKYKQ